MTFKELFHFFLELCSYTAMVVWAGGVLFGFYVLATSKGTLRKRWRDHFGSGT